MVDHTVARVDRPATDYMLSGCERAVFNPASQAGFSQVDNKYV